METSTSFWSTLDSWRARRAAVFGKWFMIYFWTQIFMIILAFLSSLRLVNGMPADLLVLLSYGYSVTEVVIFYQLGRQEDRFKTSAGLALIALVAGIIIQLLHSEVLAGLWRIPGRIINLIALYHFMIGCVEILLTTDGKLSDKWRSLWKWYIDLRVGLIVGLPALLIMALIFESTLLANLALILMIGIAIALVVVAILWLVYLYRTARCFQQIGKTLESSPGSDAN